MATGDTAPPALRWDGDTPHNLDFDDGYTARGDGLAETRHVFLQGNDLAPRFAAADRFTIGELGFGTGLNLAATWRLWRQQAPPTATLNYIACEKAPLRPNDMLRALGRWPELTREAGEIARACEHLAAGFNLRILAGGRLRLLILVGDAAEQLSQLVGRIDAWFLDGFSPARNPELWSPAVCEQLAELSHAGTTLATYTAAGWVRRQLQAVGFAVGKAPGHGSKRDMSVGTADAIATPDARLPAWARCTGTNEQQLTIVGAGLAGASTAAALARLGRSITVWDDAAPSPSRLPAMLIRPWPERPGHALAGFYANAFGCAAHGLQGAPGWHPHGVALVSERAVPEHLMADATALAARSGVGVRGGGAWLTGAGCLQPEIWREALLDQPNITLRKARWSPEQTTGPTILATGAAQQSLLAELPASITRGQMSRVGITENFSPAASISGAGLCARTPDGVWVGSSFVHDAHDTLPRAEEAQGYLDKWRALIPTLPAAPSEHRAALRVAGKGRMPYIGPLNANGILWANWAHGSRGATASLLSAEYLAAMIDGHPLPLPVDQILKLHPQRVTAGAA